MSFLLAEILNFQCALHLKGVGSLNYIIDINDDSYIVMDKKYLYKKNLSGKELWKVKLEKNYIKDEVKVEIAGDWLFIKSFDLKSEQSHLEEKIDLKNGRKIKK